MDADWHASAKQCPKELMWKNGKSCTVTTEKCAGQQEPKSQVRVKKAKAFRVMKAAKDTGEDHHDPARKENILGRKETRLELWEEHVKDPIIALDKALKCLENPLTLLSRSPGGWPLARSFSWEVAWIAMACSCLGTEILPKMWGGRFGKAFCLAWTRGTGKYEPHGELFFFLVKKEPVVASDDVSSNPFVSPETLKACALVGLHLVAEGEAGSRGSQSPVLEDMWRHGCPISREWNSY